MFKAKVNFNDGNSEYVIVSGYAVEDSLVTIKDEYYYKDKINSILFERISDAGDMVEVTYDAYDMIESYGDTVIINC